MTFHIVILTLFFDNFRPPSGWISYLNSPLPRTRKQSRALKSQTPSGMHAAEVSSPRVCGIFKLYASSNQATYVVIDKKYASIIVFRLKLLTSPMPLPPAPPIYDPASLCNARTAELWNRTSQSGHPSPFHTVL